MPLSSSKGCGELLFRLYPRRARCCRGGGGPRLPSRPLGGDARTLRFRSIFSEPYGRTSSAFNGSCLLLLKRGLGLGGGATGGEGGGDVAVDVALAGR
eukprot:scaffold3210_cov402-Prasinococcus_capsulatus_cf.AAC.21